MSIFSLECQTINLSMGKNYPLGNVFLPRGTRQPQDGAEQIPQTTHALGEFFAVYTMPYTTLGHQPPTCMIVRETERSRPSHLAVSSSQSAREPRPFL